MSEREYLAELIKGDRHGFNMLYKKYSRLLYLFSLKFVKDEQTAIDVVQDAFLKVWECRATLRNEGTFSAYLMKIAHNNILNGIRKNLAHEKYKLYQINHVGLHDDSTENQIVYRDLFKATRLVIDQLPEKRRIIFKLSRDQGLSNMEIATKLNLSVRTVECQINKALLFLKEKLLQEDVGTPSAMSQSRQYR